MKAHADSLKDLHDRSTALAAALRHGVEPGDRVLVVMQQPARVELETLLAVSAAGAIAIPDQHQDDRVRERSSSPLTLPLKALIADGAMAELAAAVTADVRLSRPWWESTTPHRDNLTINT